MMCKEPPDSDNIPTSFDRWLTRRGLQGNPFEKRNAEHDEDLTCYFVDVSGFDELLHLAEPCVVFTKRGCGKTAQRQMLAAQCRPLSRNGSMLAVTYTYSGFEHALESASNDVRQLRSSHHVRVLLRLGLSTLMSVASYDPDVHNKLASPGVASRLVAYVARFAPHLRDGANAGISSSLDDLSSLELMEGFAGLVKDAGLESCMVLVDGLDEFPRTADDPVQATAFLAPLLGTLALIECPGWVFKFFLPQELEPNLRACKWFRADRLYFFHISWSESALQALISHRLVYFSEREHPYQDLAQLCEEQLGQVINSELVALAEGSPRAALTLADKLFRSHCRQSAPPELIALDTWEQVKTYWLAHREDFMAEDSSLAISGQGLKPEAGPAEETATRPVLIFDMEKRLLWLGDNDITGKDQPTRLPRVGVPLRVSG
ncbi:MAG: hypothetical protein ABIK79_09760 [Chloroflexota bacterium]